MLLNVAHQPGLPRFKKTKGGGLRCYPTPRDLGDVELVVLHQWGAQASLTLAPGETLEECAIRRARSVPYHLSVFAGSLVVWAWCLTISSWASNGFNRTSIAIGVGGRFPELEQLRLSTHSQVAAFEAGLVEALAAVAELLPGRTIVTHCQSSRARRADPGEALARIAAREAPRLGLRVDYSRTLGTGAACPASWSLTT